MRKSLGYNWNATETRLHFEGNEMISEDILHGKYVQAILDKNQADRSQGINTRAKGRHAARIPMPMLVEWQKEWKRYHSDKWTWKTFLAMRINSRDYSKLRTGVNKL